jgi:HAD superfamily hydrolase (TIGR01450 family)
LTRFRDVDAVVFDIDGTLVHAADPGSVQGAKAVEDAAATLEHVRASGRRVLCFTNGTGRTPTDYVDDLRAVGLPLGEGEFMNPAIVAAQWIARRHAGARVLVLGGPGVSDPLCERGVEVVRDGSRPADVVLVGWDTSLAYEALRNACESVWAGAPLYATSTAPFFSVAGGRAPGWSGAVAAGIRQTTSKRPVTLGKPSSRALQESCRAIGVDPRRTLVVGDDLDLDIAMARRAGARSALVLTGISTAANVRALPRAQRPDVVLGTVGALRELL